MNPQDDHAEGTSARHKQLWGAISALGLWLLFDAVQCLQPRALHLSRVHPSVEVPLLLALYLFSHSPKVSQRTGRSLRAALAVGAVLLFLYGVDRAIWRFLMHSDPLLYDQGVMVRHTLVLVGDLLSWKLVAALAVVVFVATVLARVSAFLLATVRQGLAEQSHGRARWIFLACTGAALVLAVPPTRVFSTALGGSVPLLPRALSADFFRDARASLAMARQLDRDIKVSAYRKFDRIRLTRKPDVEFIFIESYGRLLHDEPRLRKIWHTWLEELDQTARVSGLSAVSSFSQAPVSGGRSWIAEGSVLMGSPIKYEVVFRRLVEEINRVPHLVRFLNNQGYETVLLAPADRARLGIENENRYSYDQTITYNDLGYDGPPIGWGLVPDLYSLRWAQKHVLDTIEAPRFFNFHMVSSHAPWEQVPAWEDEPQPPPPSQRTRSAPGTVDRNAELKKRLRRLRRDEDHVFAYHGEVDSIGLDAYAQAIHYELRVIGEHLARGTRDRIIVLMGDHQPPLITEANSSFQVPIHVLSTDGSLLSDFSAHGFEAGLIPNGENHVGHETLFSLLVRTLARHSGNTGTLPEVLPSGAPLGG